MGCSSLSVISVRACSQRARLLTWLGGDEQPRSGYLTPAPRRKDWEGGEATACQSSLADHQNLSALYNWALFPFAHLTKHTIPLLNPTGSSPSTREQKLLAGQGKQRFQSTAEQRKCFSSCTGLEGTSALGFGPWLKAGPPLLVLLLVEPSLSLEMLRIPQQLIPVPF